MSVATCRALDAQHVADAVRWACVLDVQAFKPGNVSLASPGHGMRGEDFLRSAEVAAKVLSAPGLRVGERIFRAVEATRRVVGCNTNLGIALLCAPLVQAAVEPRAGVALRPRLEAVLAELTLDDAEMAYRAIRLAAPGGLGRSERHDVAMPPCVSLLEAMQEASRWDRIACQYATGFRDVLETAVPRAEQALRQWGSETWAAVAVYLTLLARFPDTHVQRKLSPEAARAVSRKAVDLDWELQACGDLQTMLPKLAAFDQELKGAGINPGTSADLTVAALLAMRIEQLFEDQKSVVTSGHCNRRASARAFVHQP